MKFKDLEYIALEGGGGKGAVYLGAIQALEELCKNDTLNLENAEGINEGKSILDYRDKKTTLLKIKGISGSSAGAITAFPLALGLNSEDIQTILKGYEFEKEFMSSSLHEGKYRMVGMNSKGEAKVLIAEDKYKKLGENKIEQFKFDFVIAELNGTKKKDVGSNGIKSLIRNQVISFVIKTIVSGFLHIYEPINDFVKKLKKQGKITSLMTAGEIEKVEDNVELGPFSVKFFKVFETGAGVIFSYFGKIINSPANLSNSSVNVLFNSIKYFSPKKIGGFIPRDKIISAVSNIIWDRGVYAGFEIREFFFRILLLSLSKDTHFRRKLIEKDSLKSHKISKDDILGLEGCINDFKFVDKDKHAKKLELLSSFLAEYLTFEVFYEITGINLSCCVSNSTSGQPTYFSAYFTPNYPVIEAMGASMSFPLAFKPLYNEANVIVEKDTLNLAIKIGSDDFIKSGKTKFGTLIYKESFSNSDYNKYHNVVLTYIKERCNLLFSLNSNLSFRSYLPYLRAIIHKKDFVKYEYKNAYTKDIAEFTNNEIKQLCYFYYNSAFKGLLVDGGATNNLPIAVHTYLTPDHEKTKPDNKLLDYSNLQNLEIKKNVFSLKLDNSFPQNIKTEIENEVKALTKAYNMQMEDFYSSMDEQTFIPIKSIFEFRIKRIMKQKFNSSLDKEVIEKIIEELKEEYKRNKKGFSPWNKQILFLNTVLSPLQFGMDQGQIENIQDNENIIPLYCYGLSIFDFDLKKLKPLVDIANKESKKSVEKYFE